MSLPPYPGPHADAYGSPYAHPYAHPYADPYAQPRPGLAYDVPGRSRRALIGATAAATAAGLVVAGFVVGQNESSTVTGSGSGGSVAQAPQNPTSGGGVFPNTDPNSGSTGGSSGSTTSASVATATQQQGIVTIVSVLKYQNAEAAGTGMIISSNGEILTNNHVINGATSVTVTVESTGKSYAADVVGTDPSDDVAVLRLRGASGLTTAKVGDSSDIAALGVGDAVTGVGNANGTGTLTTASGKVTALNQSITASDESGQNAENLTGLIEIDAAIVSGDSGGPLYDADGDIVGINTAGATSNGTQTTSTAYSIPITKALAVAQEIESGVQTTTIHIGLPAFIGVGVVDTSTSGAGIGSVLSGGPADKAGITAGSVITAINGKSVTSASSLSTRLAALNPGDRTTVTWTDTAGRSRTATIVLATGPAD